MMSSKLFINPMRLKLHKSCSLRSNGYGRWVLSPVQTPMPVRCTSDSPVQTPSASLPLSGLYSNPRLLCWLAEGAMVWDACCHLLIGQRLRKVANNLLDIVISPLLIYLFTHKLKQLIILGPVLVLILA